MLAPELVKTPILAVPPALTVTLALANVRTLAVPFCMDVASIPVSWLPLPNRKLPVILPVADTDPPVTRLAAVTLPLLLIVPEFSDVSVPTEVTLGCAAVVSVPLTLVPARLPPVMLPVAEIVPPVTTLPAVTLPVADAAARLPTRLSSITVIPLILIAIFVLLFYELGLFPFGSPFYC